MLKDDILFVGVGQCGSNIVQEFEKFKFNTFYINTSLEDLDTVKADPSIKYHIPKTKGMAKDHEFAKGILSQNDNKQIIVDKIYGAYSNCRIVYFVGSSGGGTGGAMTSEIAEEYADTFPEKIVNAVTAIPSKNEDMLVQANSIKSIKQLLNVYEAGFITNVHILDNDKKDNFLKINHDFATLFNSLISFDEVTIKGNLDMEEMERLITQRGIVSAIQFDDKQFDTGINNATTNTVYADWLKISDIQGYILSNDNNNTTCEQLIHETFGIPKTKYSSSWDNDTNIILSISEKPNPNILARISKTFEEINIKRQQLQKEVNEEIIEDVTVDIDYSIFNLGSKTTRGQRTTKSAIDSETLSNTTAPNNQRRSGRRRASVSNTLDSMRNLK